MPNQTLLYKSLTVANIKLYFMFRSFLLGLSLLLVQSVYAQNNELGIRLSYNATEKISPIERSGISVTGYYKIKKGEKFAIVPSLQYRKQSFKDNALQIYQTVEVQYFSVPFALRFYPFNSKPLNDLYVLGGVQADLVIKAEAEDNSTGERKDIHNLFNYTDGGYFFGWGYNIKQKVDIQMKWYTGLGDRYITPSVDSNTPENSYFEVSFAFVLFSE